MSAQVCFHCSEPVPSNLKLSVVLDGVAQPVCCHGCEAVMQTILDAGLANYYRARETPAPGVNPAPELESQLSQLGIYDDQSIASDYTQVVNDTDVSCVLSIEGMHCGACVWLLERTIRAVPGVQKASVNYSTSRAHLHFSPSKTSLSAVLKRIAKIGYAAKPFDARAQERLLKTESRHQQQRLFVAGIGAMQVMMYALPAYFSGLNHIDFTSSQLMRWASFFITTPVLLYSAKPFWLGAWRDLRAKRPGMDVPVTIGLFAAYGISVYHTLTAQGEIYFDSVAMFVFLLLGARFIEWSIRSRAIRVVDNVIARAPATAERLLLSPADGSETVAAARLQEGDLIRVSNGGRVPVDILITDGVSAVDKSVLTGESMPVSVAMGDTVPAGSLVLNSPVIGRVVRIQSQSTLSIIDDLINRGAAEKPQAVEAADAIASYFVLAVLLVSAIVGVIWWWLDSSRAVSVALTVLVVSCPCALSLATPAAIAASTGRLLQERILLTRGHALAALAQVSDVVFDKTGTLTEGQPKLTHIQLFSHDVAVVQEAQVTPAAEHLKHSSAQAVVELACALSEGSSHPFTVALREAALSFSSEKSSLSSTLRVSFSDVAANSASTRQGAKTVYDKGEISQLHHEPGRGIEALIQLPDQRVRRLRLGSPLWCGTDVAEQNRSKDDITDKQRQASSQVLLAYVDENGQCQQLLAEFEFCDQLRKDAQRVTSALQQQGLRVHLLSGDRSQAVQAVAEELGMTRWQSQALPEEKKQYVQQLQQSGATVLMLGDGVNDAPVLRVADVSMAVASASAVARSAADAISLSDDLTAIELLLLQARRNRKIVRQNLLWAASYNAMAIPAAAMGLLPAWLAAVGMASSSLLVALNALRLWKATKQ